MVQYSVANPRSNSEGEELPQADVDCGRLFRASPWSSWQREWGAAELSHSFIWVKPTVEQQTWNSFQWVAIHTEAFNIRPKYLENRTRESRMSEQTEIFSQRQNQNWALNYVLKSIWNTKGLNKIFSLKIQEFKVSLYFTNFIDQSR